MRAGHDIVVLEARERVGGRVLTLRAPFTDGLFAEAGAARIPPDHELTLAYARHFGLELDPFYPGTGTYVRLADGVRTQVPASNFLLDKRDFVKVRGGMDGLPVAFASALGSRVLLGVPVAAITQAAGAVHVRGDDASEISVDRVLCTVPIPVLGRIAFEPALSQEKVQAVEGGFDYRPATRVFVQFRERFWGAEGSNGWAETDWPEELWHPTWDLPGPEGVLLSYVRDNRALELDALDPDGRAARVLQHWEDVFPGVGAHADRWASHSWAQDPWSGGAWAIPTPSQDAELGLHVGRAEGQVHFAGEHASDWPGWMQGALSSGLRAAREINEAPVGRTLLAVGPVTQPADPGPGAWARGVRGRCLSPRQATRQRSTGCRR